MKTSRFCLGLIFFSNACVFAPQLSAEALTFEIEPSSEGLYNVGVFYDTVNQITLNFGLEQPNIVGTDDNLTLDISYSRSSRSLSIRSTDPDLFESPWSRTFSLSAHQIYTNEDIFREFGFETAEAEIAFARDFSSGRNISVALGYNLLDFTRSADLPQLIVDSDILDGGQVHTGYLSVNNTYSTALEGENFVTSGATVINSLTIGNAGSTPYAVGQIFAQRVIPFGEQLFAKGRIDAFAGITQEDTFPFNANTFVGGPGSVRGYKPGSLGPLSPMQTSGENTVMGGQYAISSSLEIGMVLGTNRNFALFAFADAGDTANNTSDLQPSKLKLTNGFGFRWLSPIGPLDLSYAKPIRNIVSDRTQELQFSLGWFL